MLKVSEYTMLKDALDRAEMRLTRNLNNIFWGFVQYSGYHITFMGLCAYLLKDMPIWYIAIPLGVVIIIVGRRINKTAFMTFNAYSAKLGANESVVEELEKQLKALFPLFILQQNVENECKKPLLSSAGKARQMILKSLWIAEICFGIFSICFGIFSICMLYM